MSLWDSDRRFSLPPDGTPSLLFRFVDATGEEVVLGARAYSIEIDAFSPGTSCEAELRFWADVADRFVRPGATFEIHYPRQVGVGEVHDVSLDEPTSSA